jgi:hypothetical protein
VTVPPARYLAISGTGAPGGTEFQAAVEALYPVAYRLMFMLRERGVASHVGPLEALWDRRSGAHGWAIGEEAFDPSAWTWTLAMRVPEGATLADASAALEAARARRPSPAFGRLRVLELDEGLAVEAMHVGPYASEPETIEAMLTLAREAGLAPCGSHHEIYLGDPRRTAPERLRTVLRQPLAARH